MESKFTVEVTKYIDTIAIDLQPTVNYLRTLMLGIDDHISEHIKWNSPAFYYSGPMRAFDAKTYKSDILVMHLRKGNVMCVLPTGESIHQNTALLEGNFTDGRRMITFKNVDDIKQKEKLFIATIKEWLSLVETA